MASSTPHLQTRIQVLDTVDGPVSEEWLRGVAERTLALEQPESKGALSVVVADDDTVRALNSRHRGLDETTDVLSFSLSHQGEYYGEKQPGPEWPGAAAFVLPPGEDSGLGEVIISYPQAVRQAHESSHEVEQELALLLTHGILHLLGHDHVRPDEEAAMKAKEAKVLGQLTEHE